MWSSSPSSRASALWGATSAGGEAGGGAHAAAAAAAGAGAGQARSGPQCFSASAVRGAASDSCRSCRRRPCSMHECVSDEHYPPSLLAMYGLDNEVGWCLGSRQAGRQQLARVPRCSAREPMRVLPTHRDQRAVHATTCCLRLSPPRRPRATPRAAPLSAGSRAWLPASRRSRRRAARPSRRRRGTGWCTSLGMSQQVRWRSCWAGRASGCEAAAHAAGWLLSACSPAPCAFSSPAPPPPSCRADHQHARVGGRPARRAAERRERAVRGVDGGHVGGARRVHQRGGSERGHVPPDPGQRGVPAAKPLCRWVGWRRR